MLSLFCLQFFIIDKKSNLVLIGIDFDLKLRFCTVRKAFGTDVYNFSDTLSSPALSVVRVTNGKKVDYNSARCSRNGQA